MDYQNPKVIEQLKTMLHYQCSLNDVFDPKWRENRHAYLRALLVEGGEMIDHYGYKWWKKLFKDLPQAQLEVVDSLHFKLSEVARDNLDNAEDALIKGWLENDPVIEFDGKLYTIDELSALDKMELMMGLAVSRRINWALFRAIMKDLEMSFEMLHHQYAAKNVLNLFRQRNGDKQGTYIKVWSGKEDNIYLAELMKKWTSEETMNDLYCRLEDQYKQYAD